ncbi:CvfB family protein [Portibacter marinus]|uniref:CvfB family protein n=1 Tax=Portibacter marinus TaxID=2898660 RepID=UPI001F39B95A|nr:hypothetical protein [Portibacter marinus]
MLKVGEIQKLKVLSVDGNTIKLEHGIELEGTEVNTGDELEVFVYNDGDEIEGTLKKPYITKGKFETLTVTEINMIGAFCDMGIEKDLFIPYRNQTKDMIPNRKYVVHMYLDELTNRLVGTAKLKPFLQATADEDIKFGQKVDLLIYSETQLGYMAVINQKYDGLIYESETHGRILRHGEALKGYIKPIREDGKIDISLLPIGHKSIEPNAEKIWSILKSTPDGFLPYNDKSDATAIRKEFGISKKLFKKAIGGLYKNRQITIEKDGIRLVN